MGRLLRVAVVALALFPAGSATAAGTSACHRGAPPIIRDGFPQPPARYSRNGVLDTTLRASVGPVLINGERVIAQNYEGSVPGPTLVVCAGDKLKIRFRNDLSEPTNLHTHGFHVSPRANHDNVYLDLPPGKRFDYEYSIPKNNSAGSYWYHPHKHMLVQSQIFGGLAGAIVEEGGLDRLPSLRKVPQRWMVIGSTEVRAGRVLPVAQATLPKSLLYVNGAINPTVRIRPGQIQRWRIFNATANQIFVLKLPGHSFRDLAHDATTLRRARTVGQLLIPPGSRREVLVRGGARGSYVMRSLPFAQRPGFDRPGGGGSPLNAAVLTLKSSGRKVTGARFPRKVLKHSPDLRRARVNRRRTIVFDRKDPPPSLTFPLNGHTFDPNRVLTMRLNSVEEWKLVNRNPEWHTFHIHINDFQVVSVNGRRRKFLDYEDNVALPPGGTVVIRMKPIDFTGKFVFHCHLTFHEDRGMMAAVQVAKKPTPAQLQPSLATDGHVTMSSAGYGSQDPPAPGVVPLFLCPIGQASLTTTTRGSRSAASVTVERT